MNMTYAPPKPFPAPSGMKVKMWLEQQIWGHRFLNDQTPWLLLLEAIGIMASRVADKNCPALFEGIEAGHESFKYTLYARTNLRAILFKDRHIDEIADGQATSDSVMWALWLDRVPGGRDRFGYLQKRFTNFRSFRNAVSLLRGAEVDAGRKRRPTSRHLAPRGFEMLSADYGERKSGFDKDRRFFSRGGELLYMMLNRSASRPELETAVRAHLGTDSRWNALARVLQPATPPTDEVMDFDVGYLPLPKHPAYDRAGEDWLAILSLTGLPEDNKPELLMRLSGLSVVLYMLERAAETVGENPPPMPIDMVSANTTAVQKISKDQFRRNRELTRMAIHRVIDDFVQSEDWKQALKQANPHRAVSDLVQNKFDYTVQSTMPRDVPDEMRQYAIAAHDQHLGQVTGICADQIGFCVARRGNGRWYGASDGLLEALVLANVREPMEYEDFLKRLWTRYRIVIGSEIGREQFEAVNYSSFKANQRLLEDRLRILGLVKRLSDDCAFVSNPFFESNR